MKINSLTEEERIQTAWSTLKDQLGADTWTTGEAANYRGFFVWGWKMKAAMDQAQKKLNDQTPC